MCRIEERVYISPDGHQSTFDETFRCDRGRRHNRTCSDARVHTTKYRTGTSTHDPASSPMSSPITPVAPRFNTRERRPSTSSRPSTRDGPVNSVDPSIRITIGGKGVSITTGKVHRSSMESTSAIDSPGSDASQTIRTGYPDAALPLNSGYSGIQSQQGHHGIPSSDEFLLGSGRAAHVYHTSDEYDTPSLATGTTGTSSGSRPVIHHATRHTSSTDTTRGHAGSPSSPYRTTEFAPRGVYNDAHGRTGRSSRPTSSHGGSIAPEIIGRGEDRERRREARRQQEALDREVSASLMREENAKQVRFETSRAPQRAEQPANNSFAAHEQRRTEGREHSRQQEKKERDAQAAREAAAKQSRSSATTTKPTRRGSVHKASAAAAEQQRLIAADARQMEQERIRAEAIEREEQMQQQSTLPLRQPPSLREQPPSLREQQQDPGYYDPRGRRTTQPSGQMPPIRRPSQSGQVRPSLPQARQERQQPPVSYYNSNPPPPRERRLSSSHGTRPTSMSAQSSSNGDPWDSRNMRDALPSARGAQVGHNFQQPQQASLRMNQALYDDEFED